MLAGSGAIAGDRAVAIKIGQKVNAEAAEVYRVVRQAPMYQHLILNGRVYLWNDGGIRTCCQLDDGEVIGRTRLNYFRPLLQLAIVSSRLTQTGGCRAGSQRYLSCHRTQSDGAGQSIDDGYAENTLLYISRQELSAMGE